MAPTKKSLSRKPKQPAAAHGRRLSDFDKLQPAEEKLLACAARGEMCVINEERPEEQTKGTLVRAGFLRFLALGGDDTTPVHERGVTIKGAWIKGEKINDGQVLDFEACTLPAPIGLWSCHLNGALILRNSKTRTVNLQASAVDGIEGDGAVIDGSLLLRGGFETAGEVRLLGVRIKGELDCTGGVFNGEVNTLICDRADIAGSAFLKEGFRAADEVSFVSARISGQLSCTGGVFDGKERALSCDGADIRRDVNLKKGFRAAGEVRFHGARIGGNLSCMGAVFAGAESSLSLQSALVTSSWFWRDVETVAGIVDLTDAQVGTLGDDKASWNKTDCIFLDGFTYHRFAGDQSWRDIEFLKDWLDKQPKQHRTTDFKPQPFEQLAKVLKAEGHEYRAKEILILKRRRQRRARRHWHWREKLWSYVRDWLSIWWDWVLEKVVGYGYRPWRAVLGLASIWVAGALIFWAASHAGIMAPTNPLVYLSKDIPQLCRENWVHGPEAKDSTGAHRRFWIEPGNPKPSPDSAWNDYRNICARAIPSEYSTFNALIYSVDIGVPLVDLSQEAKWAPRVVKPDGTNWVAGHVVLFWEWFEIGAGWVLSLLFATAIGGVIRKE